MATYSYKPASGGLEGASTVVPLKAGGFLEVRRGEKTRWAPGEVRQMWATLEDWKETLPVDAVVTVSTRAPSAIPMADGLSADFQTGVEVMTSVIGTPLFASVKVSTYVCQFASLMRQAVRIEYFLQSYEGYGAAWPAWLTREYVSKMRRRAEEIRRLPADEQASPVIRLQTCQRYSKSGIASALHAQRISDGEFIPLFFDKRRRVIHTPTDIPEKEGLVGTTFAELGVRPIFIMRNNSGHLRIVSLEKTAGAE